MRDELADPYFIEPRGRGSQQAVQRFWDAEKLSVAPNRVGDSALIGCGAKIRHVLADLVWPGPRGRIPRFAYMMAVNDLRL